MSMQSPGPSLLPEEGQIPPPPPDNASPEEKDAYWLRYVYQGDRMPQLTLRAVLMGGFLGMFLSISNLYTSIKIGWLFGVAITACVMSYVIWNGMRGLSGGRLSKMSILENNCMQSTASAAGYSTGSTIGTAFGALLLITGQHTPWYILLPFTFFTAALGVFLAVPMKRQMINNERLKFPSGIAAAETLRSLYSEGRAAVHKARALIGGLAVGAIVGLLKTSHGTIQALDNWFAWMQANLFPVKIPDLLPENGFILGQRALRGFGWEPGLLLIAAGVIIGLRVTLSMFIASAFLYFFVAPELIAADQAAIAAGAVDYVSSIDQVATLPNGTPVFHPYRWSLWGGASLMVFASLTSVAVQWRTIGRAFMSIGKGGSPTASSAAGIEVPIRWLIIGLIPITIGMVLVQKLAFGINPALGLVAVALSFGVTLVCCRATGETDTTPIGAMGKLVQLVFGLLAPSDKTINLMTASVAANAGSASADLLTDLKSGYLLGANPRKQFIAQFVGIFFGCVAVVPAWYLMIPTKEVLEGMDPPNTMLWKAVADALAEGLDKLPHSAQMAIVIGGVVGVVVQLLPTLMPRLAKYAPSAIGFGLAWIMPFQNSLAFFLGGVVVTLWTRLHRRNSDKYSIPVASGVIAGESLMSAIIAMTATVIGLMAAQGDAPAQ